MSRPEIGPSYVRLMAAYNAEMNERLYGAADRLDEAERRRDRGAFWGSIHRTLCHILWGDQMWMSRFSDVTPPPVPMSGGADMIDDYAAVRTRRREIDAAISAWAAGVDQAWLDADLTWYSGAAQREYTLPNALLVTHFFNHQTHHRGQAHALITAAGETTGDTDLFLVVSAEV